MKGKYFVILLVVFLMTGCWNYRDLNEMAIVGAIGIDYDKENKLYDVTIQIFNAKKTSTGGSSNTGLQSPITIFQGKAKTVHEAIRNIMYSSPKKPYIGHLDVIVFGESLVEKGFIPASDFLFRDDESRKDFDVIVTQNAKASDVLKVLTTSESLPSVSIRNNIISNSMYKGTTIPVSFDQMISNYYTNGIETTLPIITIDGDSKDGDSNDITKSSDPKTTLVIENTAVFREDKMVGYFDDQESLGYALTIGKIGNTVISFKCDKKDNYAGIEINKYKSKIKGILKDNKPTIQIDVEASGLISEYNCEKNLKLPKESYEVGKMAAEEIKKIISKTINKAQKDFKSDVFGFGESFYRTNYQYWKKVKKDWDEIFENLEYKVNVNVLLPDKGSIIVPTKGGEKLGR